MYTAINGVVQNSCFGHLNVHSSTTPNIFQGVTGHPQNNLTSASESLKGVLCKHAKTAYNNNYCAAISGKK